MVFVHSPRNIDVQRTIFVEIIVVLQIHAARQNRLSLKERTQVIKIAKHSVFPEVREPYDREHAIQYAQHPRDMPVRVPLHGVEIEHGALNLRQLPDGTNFSIAFTKTSCASSSATARSFTYR